MESVNKYGYRKGTTPFKSWAQQTEESYQLQLALVLRVSSRAASADDPNFLDINPAEQPTASPETLSHRFWVFSAWKNVVPIVNGCLSYFDRIPDGFYLIHGMDPYVWTISADQQDMGQIPSYESLKAIDPCNGLPIKVVLINKFRDPGLKELRYRVMSLSCNWVSAEDAIHQLANLVCHRMGGAASTEGEGLGVRWKECAEALKDCLGTVVLPIGSLSVGLCVHRALLFKVLADLVYLPCRIAEGCKYCKRDDASSCLVKIASDREYVVDLFGEPGALSQPDSSLNSRSSVLVSSPFCHPKLKAVGISQKFRTSGKQHFYNNQSHKVALHDATSGDNHKCSVSPLLQIDVRKSTLDSDLQILDSSNIFPELRNLSHFIKGSLLPSPILPIGHGEIQQISAFSRPKPAMMNNLSFKGVNQAVWSTASHELFLEEEFNIAWTELIIKNRIGRGSFGTVHRAKWQDADVAVKVLEEQEFHAHRFEEFVREVAIMKHLRHPNIVLLMGAVTQPPYLSIVTEYVSRGSLYKLLHVPDSRMVLDERRRLKMAYDVVNGMNYLHQFKPPIVHRDLKSPNLLVDSNYTVKICDFGLSRSKANTYLSSKTAEGTPEWMAPEVLREELSDEKSDVFSFGVILWELVTLQQPWRNSTSSQVIGAVGFNSKRLEIPNNVNPVVAALIKSCWAEIFARHSLLLLPIEEM
ncbi:hypothetical protein JRO89_XS14G0015800 [Xanthoceras sorbifolium]|uniref:Protein kinase domain-containing protein n=1 Tax=Xanthoceras sorbifolium TaxID=99658 RepID=A0ABQ8H3B1_9ROSI|nr:hypothetical protein JRO89_XS14G0015800 [Xanthoceras sorbifolium]